MGHHDHRRRLLLFFLDNLRAHLIASRFSRQVYGSALTPAEALVIDYAGQYNHLASSEIARLLVLPVSRISRILSRLEHRGYLQRVAIRGNATKRRAWNLTTAGHDFIQLQNEYNSRQVQEQLKHLSDQDRDQLATTLTSIARKSRAPTLPGPSTTDSERVLMAMRRLSIAHGLLGDSYVGSGYSALDWVILSEVAYNDLTLTLLSARLEIPITNVNQLLRGTKLSKLVRPSSTMPLRGGKKLEILPAGGETLAMVEDRALSVLHLGTQALSNEALRDFTRLFARYVGQGVAKRDY